MDKFGSIIPKGKTENVPVDERPDIDQIINKIFLSSNGNHVHYKFSYEGNEQEPLENVSNSYLSKCDDAGNFKIAIIEGDLFSQGVLSWALSQCAQVKVTILNCTIK
ncbi:hypothetical protein [Companilactobacillus zhachilii]|uniref:hypothetical protein n=1 Tax=Companilactobacillus zhachilii TaxID=2304606 RepID=UPI0040335295